MTLKRTLAVLATLGLTLTVAPTGAQEAVAAPQDLPSPQSIIERYVEAVGGEKAIRATEGIHQVGTMEMPAMGMSAELEIYLAPPNKMLMKMVLPQVGAINTGFNGEIGWIENPMTGPMLMEGEQLEQAIEQADFYSDLNYSSRYASMETVGIVEFAGEQAYKVALVDQDGDQTTEYFSVDSGLKVGFEAEQASEMGTVLVVTELHDWKEVDGRMVPATTLAKMMGQEMSMKIDTISFEAIAPEVFEVPASIKTLAEKVKENGAGG